MRTAACSKPLMEKLEHRRLLSFAPAVSYLAGSGPYDMKAADFNGDGILDLATANLYSRSASVLLGNADGTFRPLLTTATSASPYQLVVADFNEDGKLDLATSANGGGATVGVNVLLGHGDGRFVNVNPNLLSGAALGFAWSSAIATGDLLGRGTLDIVTSSVDPFDGYSDVRVNLGRGDGTFSYRSSDGQWPGNPANGYSLALGDFNGDGTLDLVVGGDDSIFVYPGNGDGTFSSYYPIFTGAVSLTVADFNADGKLDLATTAEVFLGNGNGSFQAAGPFDAPSAASRVSAGDVNGDGILDLIVANARTNIQLPGTLSILLGHGDGSFGPRITMAGPANPSSLVVADFNGDHQPDTAITDFNSNTVWVLLNDGNWPSKTYVGPMGGNWSSASNWSPSGAPISSDLVTIAGKSVNLGSSATVNTLTLTGGATLNLGAAGNRVLRTSGLAITGAGSKLNLNDNDLIVDNGNFTALRTLVLSGFGPLATSGITSSTSNGSQVLALFDNAFVGATHWAGQSIPPTAIVGKYTYLGDANLDGKVTGDDYAVIDANLNTTPPAGFAWLAGDMNLDGSISGDDYTVVDANLGLGSGSPLSPSDLTVSTKKRREEDF